MTKIEKLKTPLAWGITKSLWSQIVYQYMVSTLSSAHILFQWFVQKTIKLTRRDATCNFLIVNLLVVIGSWNGIFKDALGVKLFNM